jgi:hypothetical protein
MVGRGAGTGPEGATGAETTVTDPELAGLAAVSDFEQPPAKRLMREPAARPPRR